MRKIGVLLHAEPGVFVLVEGDDVGGILRGSSGCIAFGFAGREHSIGAWPDQRLERNFRWMSNCAGIIRLKVQGQISLIELQTEESSHARYRHPSSRSER